MSDPLREENTRLRRLLAVMADDTFHLFIGRRDAPPHDFCLIVNCNDYFAPAADAEEVPADHEADVIRLAQADDYEGLMAWVAKQRGLSPPYHWREHMAAATPKP